MLRFEIPMRTISAPRKDLKKAQADYNSIAAIHLRDANWLKNKTDCESKLKAAKSRLATAEANLETSPR